MSRRLSIAALLLAWLCANGAVWNLVQIVGWAQMFRDNVRVLSVSQAIQATFDGSKPCDLCEISQEARNTAQDQAPLTAALGDADGKIVLLADFAPTFELAAPLPVWPALVHEAGRLRTDAVPVPPPRA